MNPEDDTVDELRKVNELLQAEVSEVSATLVMLVEAFNKIMTNQNNMNLRLLSQQEQVDSIEKDLYVRVRALESRQDPAAHNEVRESSMDRALRRQEGELHGPFDNVVSLMDSLEGEEETHS